MSIPYESINFFSEIVLGEHDVSSEKDCAESNGRTFCNINQRLSPAEIIIHEKYHKVSNGPAVSY